MLDRFNCSRHKSEMREATNLIEEAPLNTLSYLY